MKIPENLSGLESRPAKRRKSGSARAAASSGSLAIGVSCSGEWLPVEELHRKLSTAMESSKQVCLDVSGLDQVDASTLQLLLAPSREGGLVQLLNASPALCQWLTYAGATGLLELAQQKLEA